jgi:hypothetical protein
MFWVTAKDSDNSSSMGSHKWPSARDQQQSFIMTAAPVRDEGELRLGMDASVGQRPATALIANETGTQVESVDKV